MKNSNDKIKRWGVIFGAVTGVMWGAGGVDGQQLSVDGSYSSFPGQSIYYFSAVDALASRVYAQSELIRASGAAAVDFAQARKIREEAISMRIENSVKRVQAYWDRRAIGEAERLKRAVHYLKRLRTGYSKTWERLKYFPELNAAAIERGTALNFLLHRLGGTVLAYQFSQAAPDPSDRYAHLTKLPELQLTPESLHDVRLRQRHPNGKSLLFTADGGEAFDVTWWPYALRDERFQVYRENVQKARAAADKEANDGGKIPVTTIQDLDRAALELREKFDQVYNYHRRFRNGFDSWSEYYTADLFLKSLIGEIGRLKRTGNAEAFDGSMRFQGNNLIDLLMFMSRNGLEFAPSTPGAEPTYHTVFKMMRDLYVTVADEDDSVREPPKQ